MWPCQERNDPSWLHKHYVVTSHTHQDACAHNLFLSLLLCRCAPAFYSAKGSLKPCLACPAFRTTADDPALQAYIIHCIVIPGYGVVNSTANKTDAFNIDTSAMDPYDQVKLNVMECPVGYYGPGGGTGSTCIKCPCGSTTTETGSTSDAACNGE